jgi:hypothetical protein
MFREQMRMLATAGRRRRRKMKMRKQCGRRIRPTNR